MYLHIGTHKTGSTSIQNFLFDHADALLEQGIDLYRGMHLERNHVEIYLAAMRPDRDSFARHSLAEIRFDENYREAVSARIDSFLEQSDSPRALFTCEGLSLLRHDDEFALLKQVLGECAVEATVILYLRDKKQYLESYRRQLHSVRGRKPASDYWSALYVEDDSWLLDYDCLVSKYQQYFGVRNVEVIDYDERLAVDGSVLRSFLAATGIDGLESAVPDYFDNRRRGIIGRAISKLRAKW